MGDERLSPARRADLARYDVEVLVSAASGWEIATRFRIGKLAVAVRLVDELPLLVQQRGFRALDVSLLHALRAGRLPGEHRDPFDRMLAAQALVEGVPLVSADPALDAFGIERLPA